MRQALELALEALQDYVDEYGPWSDDSGAQYALRVGKEALAQPEEEKLHPVHIGVDVTREGTAVTAFYRKPDAVMEMFYSQFHPLAQPERDYERGFIDGMQKQMQSSVDKAVNAMSRIWVGLTDEEIADCAEKMEASDPTDSFWREFFRGIEAKLKEKNT